MKASLNFTLPDDSEEFDAALLGRKALSVLCAIDQHCRGIIKHGDPSDEVLHMCEAVREMIPSDLLEA